MKRIPGSRCPRRPAFTLVEAMVAIGLTALAGSVLLLGTGSSLQTTHDSQNRTMAEGMAEQLIDEVVGGRYFEYGGNPHSTTLGPDAGESARATRELFDDIDDYHGFRCQPPADCCGVQLGKDDGLGNQRHPNFQAPAGSWDHWRQEIDVCYVSETDLVTRLAAGQTSDYRAVEVRIIDNDPNRGARELVKLRRVVVYVPALP